VAHVPAQEETMDNLGKVFVVLLIGCIIGLGLMYLNNQLTDSQANRDRAQAELVRAETDRDRVANTAFQERYILFISTLVALTSGLTLTDLLLIVLTAAVAFLAAWLWKGGAANL
jgi:NADH:ubiquinone oxidoreductase subunit 3 (subunit A)